MDYKNGTLGTPSPGREPPPRTRTRPQQQYQSQQSQQPDSPPNELRNLSTIMKDVNSPAKVDSNQRYPSQHVHQHRHDHYDEYANTTRGSTNATNGSVRYNRSTAAAAVEEEADEAEEEEQPEEAAQADIDDHVNLSQSTPSRGRAGGGGGGAESPSPPPLPLASGPAASSRSNMTVPTAVPVVTHQHAHRHFHHAQPSAQSSSSYQLSYQSSTAHSYQPTSSTQPSGLSQSQRAPSRFTAAPVGLNSSAPASPSSTGSSGETVDSILQQFGLHIEREEGEATNSTYLGRPTKREGAVLAALRALQAKIRHLEVLKRQAEEKMDSGQKHETELHARYGSQIKKLQHELVGIQTTHAEHTHELHLTEANLQAQLASTERTLKLQLAAVENERNQLESKVRQQESQIAELQRNLQQATAQSAQHSTAAAQLDTRLRDMQQTLNAETTASAKRIAELEAAQGGVHSRCAELQQNLQHTQQAYQQLSTNFEQLSAELGKAKQGGADSKNALSAQLAANIAAQATLSARLNALTKQREKEAAANRLLQKQVASLNAELTAAREPKSTARLTVKTKTGNVKQKRASLPSASSSPPRPTSAGGSARHSAAAAAAAIAATARRPSSATAHSNTTTTTTSSKPRASSKSRSSIKPFSVDVALPFTVGSGKASSETHSLPAYLQASHLVGETIKADIPTRDTEEPAAAPTSSSAQPLSSSVDRKQKRVHLSVTVKGNKSRVRSAASTGATTTAAAQPVAPQSAPNQAIDYGVVVQQMEQKLREQSESYGRAVQQAQTINIGGQLSPATVAALDPLRAEVEQTTNLLQFFRAEQQQQQQQRSQPTTYPASTDNVSGDVDLDGISSGEEDTSQPLKQALRSPNARKNYQKKVQSMLLLGKLKRMQQNLI